MTDIFILNESSPAQIVTNGVYGADFKVDILNQEDGSYVSQNTNMSEITESVDSFSTNTSENNDMGSTDIKLDSTDDLNVGDRLKINNYIYRVSSINSDTITIHKGLFENVSSGSSVDRKGNLGIYKVDLTFDTLGNFTLIGKDNTFGNRVTRMIKVQNKSITTMYNDIKNLEYAILGN